MAIVALLNCGHFTEYGSYTHVPNPTGPEEECPECERWELIIQEWAYKWHAKCSLCPYHTQHGFSKRYAEESRDRHFAQTLHKAGVVWYTSAPPEAMRQIRQRNAERRQKKFPESLPDSLPPF